MIALSLQAVSVVACAVILVRAEPAINLMGKHTPTLLRVAMHFLTVGAAGMVGSIAVFGLVPDIATTILLIGIAALLICERRVRALTRGIGQSQSKKVSPQ